MTSRYEFKQVKRAPLVRDPEKEQYDWFAEQVAEIEAKRAATTMPSNSNGEDDEQFGIYFLP